MTLEEVDHGIASGEPYTVEYRMIGRDGRVRWFFGLARNSGGYSLPMMGTPCEVPEPRKVNANDIFKFLLRHANTPRKFAANNLPCSKYATCVASRLT